ncbi:MAG: DNA-directed RNA polymerase subunit alpha C-terminal domain-containing protein [Thiofilum sp.]|uniref:DNA-directed RNA polymerase subunit alpha C-terminal domain-containing protein n=1 Tax=Thiofilum sp. TaxID=2212733 RepID=UPI0025FF31B4|nr:DNA-directed RNA polymerase subunit alpha C-terminal domain-containing protein [Thiofilum sp.]MBK8454534.1 hypothetical protein [Thiofilum sp.]
MTQTADNESNEQIIIEQTDDIFEDSSSFFVSASGVKYNIHLFKSIHEIPMPIRAHNAFLRQNIIYLGDLVNTPYRNLIQTPNLGRLALESVADSLKKLNLRFDMDIPDWPPLDIISLRKRYEELALSNKK